jgi:hypothetical protein
VIERLGRLERLRGLDACLLAPALEPELKKAFIVSGGRIRVTTLSPGQRPPVSPDRLEGPLSPEQAEDLLLIDGFLRRPPPELKRAA